MLYQKKRKLFIAVGLIWISIISAVFVSPQITQAKVTELGYFNKLAINVLDDGLVEYNVTADDGSVWDNMLVSTYPKVFRYGTDYASGNGDLISFRFPLFSVKDLAGNDAGFATWSRPGSTQIFTRDGEFAYCLDYTTPAQGSRSDAGPEDLPGSWDKERIARAANLAVFLTKNNFEYFRTHADEIAKGYSSKHVTIAKEDVAQILKDTNEVATTFKHQLVQWLVWYVANDMANMSAQVEMSIGGGTSVDKDGNVVTSPLRVVDVETPDTLFGIGNILKDADKAKELTPVPVYSYAPGVQITFKIIPYLYAGVTLTKKDAENGDAQGDASLAGIRFAIINKTGQSMENKDGDEIADGEVMQIITTNAAGVASSGKTDLPYLTDANKYLLYEMQSDDKVTNHKLQKGSSNLTNDSMQRTSAEQTVTLKEADAETLVSPAKVFENKVVRGGISLRKLDLETDKNTALGGARLDDAVFELYNRSAQAVLVDGTSYEKDALLATISLDENASWTSPKEWLPYGTYELKEKTAPEGYLSAGKGLGVFTIRESGKIVGESTSDAAYEKTTRWNQVKRGDMEIRKIDADTQRTMANVSFRLTAYASDRETVLESHEFTTDENGFYSTENNWNAHSANTNGGGAADGIWFGVDAPVNDALGALPYGWYKIEEITGDENAGKWMHTDFFRISRDKYTVNLNNIENLAAPSVTTTLRDAALDDENTAGEKVALIDTVEYTDFTAQKGKDVMIRGVLMDKESGEVVTVNDEAVTAEYSWTVKAESGSVPVTFPELDRGVFAEKELVAFEYVYELDEEGEETEVTKHEDINAESQTVKVAPKESPTPTPTATPTVTPTPTPTTRTGSPYDVTNSRTGSPYAVTNTRAAKTGEGAEVILFFLLFAGAGIGIVCLHRAGRTDRKR